MQQRGGRARLLRHRGGQRRQRQARQGGGGQQPRLPARPVRVPQAVHPEAAPDRAGCRRSAADRRSQGQRARRPAVEPVPDDVPAHRAEDGAGGDGLRQRRRSRACGESGWYGCLAAVPVPACRRAAPAHLDGCQAQRRQLHVGEPRDGCRRGCCARRGNDRYPADGEGQGRVPAGWRCRLRS